MECKQGRNHGMRLCHDSPLVPDKIMRKTNIGPKICSWRWALFLKLTHELQAFLVFLI